MSSAWTLNKKKKARQINEYQNTPPVLPVFSFSNLYMDLWKGFDQLLIIYFGHEEG